MGGWPAKQEVQVQVCIPSWCKHTVLLSQKHRVSWDHVEVVGGAEQAVILSINSCWILSALTSSFTVYLLNLTDCTKVSLMQEGAYRPRVC